MRPALKSRAKTRASEEMVLPSCGDSKKQGSFVGRLLWEEDQIVFNSPCGISGSTCPSDG